MSKRRTFLRRTALSLAAGAGVYAAADVATAQIVLNGGTHNANPATTAGELNSRYWRDYEQSNHFQIGNTPFPGATNMVPFRSLESAMQFFNSTDGNGVPQQLDATQAQEKLIQAIDFPTDGTANSSAANPFVGVALVSDDDHMAMWSGILNVTNAGAHQFFTASDDASMLFIDGAIAVDNNHQQGIAGSERSTGPINLTAGQHEIVVIFQENGGDSGVFVNWQSPVVAKSLIDPAAFPTNFSSYNLYDHSTETVTVTANSTIDVQASKASFGDLTLTNSTLALTGHRAAERTTFGNATATGASGINASVDASLASLNAGGGGLTSFTKSGAAGLRIDGNSTLTNATNVVISGGTLAINASGGTQSLGSANINLAGGTLGVQNTDATPQTLGNAVSVTASSGVRLGPGPGANFGTITFTPGTTLSKTGPGANMTVATTSVPGGGTITYDVQSGGLTTTAYNSGASQLNVNKTGGGTLNLTQIGTPLAGAGAFNVQAGVLNVTNNSVGTSLGTTPVQLSGGRLRINSFGAVISSVEGLLAGYLPGSFNENAANPGTSPAPNTTGGIRLDIIHGQDGTTPNVWVGDNETWVYTGQVFDADGVFSFAEHIDDNTLVRVNGVQILRNTAWDVPTFGVANNIPDPDGDNWYDIDIRMGEGGGGQGPSGGGNPQPGWTGTYGFGFSPNAQASADGSLYTAPVEPAGGGPTLFRVPTYAAANYAAVPISVTANSSIQTAGSASDIALGTIAMSNGSTLDLVGSAKTTIQNLSVANGTTSTLNSLIPAPGITTVQNIQAAGAELRVAGAINITGAITGGKLNASAGAIANIRPTATFAGTPTIETAKNATLNFDAGGGTLNGSLITGTQRNEGTIRFSTGTTNLGGAHLIATPASFVEGLLAGYLPGGLDVGGINETLPNPGTAPGAVAPFAGVRLDVIHGNSQDDPEWLGDNETWVYTGQIFDADGVFSFAENIDDDAMVKINGVTVIRDAGWNTPTFGVANNIPDPDGDHWYDIDIRFGEYGGGAGAVADAANGWRADYGFGYSPDAETRPHGDDYIKPVEPAGGGPTLFRVFDRFGTVQVDAGATGSLGSFRNHTLVRVEGRLNMTPNGTNASTSSVDTLLIPGSGVLDIANNDMVVFSTAAGKDAELAAIVDEIKSAQNGLDANLVTKWDGPGLTSSTARATNVAQGFDLTGIGAIRNSDLNTTIPGSAYTTFDGLAVTLDDILIKYTYTGDANLSGAVTFDDYVGMDNAFFGLIPNLGWATGDINFDGVINFDDYSKVDQAFFFQGAPLGGEGGGVAAVPEPATWLLVVLGSLAGLFTWFRRK